VQIRYYLLLIWTLTGRSGSVLPLTCVNRSIRAFLARESYIGQGEEQIIRFRQSKEQLADQTYMCKIISMSTALVYQIKRYKDMCVCVCVY